MTDLATIYRITSRDGTPVTMRDGENVPRHAEMLRHDLGFCDPNDISKVVFPLFSGRNGRTSPKIARGRWASCGFLVERYDRDFVRAGRWVTYRPRTKMRRVR